MTNTILISGLVVAMLAVVLAAPPAQGQATADSIKNTKTYLVNRIMREVVIPANNPQDPDVIPVGYRAEMPDTSAARVAERGDHFWRFTTEVVDRHGLYDAWVAEGRPRPAADFARERIAEEEFTVAEEPPAPAPAPEPEPAPEAPAASAEPEEATGWSYTTLVVGVLILVALLAGAFVWQRRRGERA